MRRINKYNVFWDKLPRKMARVCKAQKCIPIGTWPSSSLKKARNFKLQFMIFHDGTSGVFVSLYVPNPRLREDIVLFHVTRNHVMFFATEAVGFNYVKRDLPWDFELESSEWGRIKVEITAVANNELSFRTEKIRGELDLASQQEQLRLGQVKALSRKVNLPDIEELIQGGHYRGVLNDTFVPNPLRTSGKILHVTRSAEPEGRLSEKLVSAVAKKTDKSHPDKHQVILVLDDQTYGIGLLELENEIAEAARQLTNSEFDEIWYYRGYYSDDDGQNAEYWMAPLKISPQRQAVYDSKRPKLSKCSASSLPLNIWPPNPT